MNAWPIFGGNIAGILQMKLRKTMIKLNRGSG
jgi:hypothetical protein